MNMEPAPKIVVENGIMDTAESDSSIVEEPTCRLKTFNEDCLCKIFEYLGPSDYVTLSQYDKDFQTIIINMILKRKLITFSGQEANLNKTFLELFGDSLRQIEINHCYFKDDGDNFVNSFKSYCTTNEIERLTIINKERFGEWKEVSIFNESQLMEILYYMSHLKTFTYTSPIRFSGMKLPEYCPLIETLNINYRGDRDMDYLSNFVNLKRLEVEVVDIADLYQILHALAKRNSVRILKIVFRKLFDMKMEQIVDLTPVFKQFTSLQWFEADWTLYNESEFDKLCGLLSTFGKLNKLTIKSDRCHTSFKENTVSRFFEAAPWIQTFRIEDLRLQKLPVAIRKTVKTLYTIKRQQSCSGVYQPLNIILNYQQLRELNVISNTGYKEFVKVSAQSSTIDC